MPRVFSGAGQWKRILSEYGITLQILSVSRTYNMSTAVTVLVGARETLPLTSRQCLCEKAAQAGRQAFAKITVTRNHRNSLRDPSDPLSSAGQSLMALIRSVR